MDSRRQDAVGSRRTGTYVYCLVAARRRPAPRVPRGLPSGARPRLLEVGSARGLRTWLVVSTVPLDRYGEDAINRRLSELDWVSRAAVAHEAVIESFIAAPAVLPMKLFTIFTSDDRALDHIRREASRVDALVRRVANHHEWGIRIVLDRAGLTAAPRARRGAAVEISGRKYLARKKAERDAAGELALHARDTVADVYDRLARRSRLARRRAAAELPIEGGPLLLDAAFLVPRTQTARFRSLAAREARAIARHGYRLTLSGPWPPYTFIQD